MASKITPDIETQIHELLDEGMSYSEIALELPGAITKNDIIHWYHRNATDEQRKAFDVARERGLEKEVDELRTIADAPMPADTFAARAESERRKMQIDVRKWRLCKLLPRKYGDRVKVDAEVSGGLNVSVTMRPPAKE